MLGLLCPFLTTRPPCAPCPTSLQWQWSQAHDFQRVGRRGLGKAEIKVGAKWEGTKKTFGEENDQEGGDPAEGGKQQLGDDEEEAQEQPHNEGAAAGKKKGKKDKKQDKEGKGSGRKAKAEADAEDGGEVKKSKRQKTAAAAAEADETPGSTVAATSAEAAEGANGGAAPPPKWLKLAKTVLKKVGWWQGDGERREAKQGRGWILPWGAPVPGVAVRQKDAGTPRLDTADAPHVLDCSRPSGE